MESKCPDETLRLRGMNLNLRILSILGNLLAWRGPYNNTISLFIKWFVLAQLQVRGQLVQLQVRGQLFKNT